MPEKIPSTTQSIENNNAIRQALVVIEHKIRNLEKRKTKLESYRAIQSSGKELSGDQKAAVAKYDEVAQSLEFARDLSKQMLQIANASDKEDKKRARREAAVRAQAETAKIREVLTIQNILIAFNNEDVRNDFLSGSNGAIKLEENDFSILEKFSFDIQVKRQESPEDLDFSTSAQRAAEHLSFTIDGRPKQYGETSYEVVKQVLQKIQDCGYLDRCGKSNQEIEEEEEPIEELNDDNTDESEEKEPEVSEMRISDQDEKASSESTSCSGGLVEETQNIKISAQVPTMIPVAIDQQNGMPKFTSEAPSAAAVPAPAFPPTNQVPSVPAGAAIPAQLQQPQIAIQQLQRQPSHPIPLQTPPTIQQIAPTGAAAPIQAVPGPPGHFPPTTVRAVEQAYFKQHQYIQQIRPLAEVIGGGNFYFLQDSELDSPELIGLPGPPHNFPNPGPPPQHNPQQQPQQQPHQQQQQQQPQQQPQQQHPQQPHQQQGLPDNQQQSSVNISSVSPTQQQQIQSSLNNVQQQTGMGGQTTNIPPNISQQVNKQVANSHPSTNVQVPSSNIGEPKTATITTQTFTNQSFPPIVPPTQVQPIFPQGVNNPVAHSPPGINQQSHIPNSNEKAHVPSQVVSTPAQLAQQNQPNQPQTQQIPPMFNQSPANMPSITPHQLIAHHQQQQQQQQQQHQQQQQSQQQSIGAQSQQSNVAGTTNNLNLAEQQVAALASLQQTQQHIQHQPMQQPSTASNNMSGLPTGFANAKFPTNIHTNVPVSQTVTAHQQQTQISAHHSINSQVVNNLNTIGNANPTNLSQHNSQQDKYDQTVRILEHKTQKLDLKDRNNQVKDIIATASVNDWESDATKLQLQQQQQQSGQQIHKPPSHYSTSHNTSHFHAAQHHSSNPNNANDRGNSNINESNQWSNDMHTNSQHGPQNVSNNTTGNLSSKNNDWASTFEAQESNHWNNNDATSNYRGRQSFGRNDRTNGSGPPGNTGGVRNNSDRNESGRGGNSGGYRGRANYSTSQNGSSNVGGPGGNGMGGGGRSSNVYFRGNDNYYQNSNGGGGGGGYNGGNKDNGNRYGSGNGNASDNYRGRPTPGGPRGTSGSGPPPRQQRSSLGNTGGGGMGPRGQTGGPRASTGGYGSRPPRQQDINVVN